MLLCCVGDNAAFKNEYWVDAYLLELNILYSLFTKEPVVFIVLVVKYVLLLILLKLGFLTPVPWSANLRFVFPIPNIAPGPPE